MPNRLRRSSVTFKVRLRQTLAIMAFLTGALFCFGSTAWHSQGTFYYLNQLPIPWWVYGLTLLIAGALLLLQKLKPVGYLIGAILYSFFGLAAWLAVLGGIHSQIWLLAELDLPPGVNGNPFSAINMTTIALIYWWCVRESIYIQVDPDRRAAC